MDALTLIIISGVLLGTIVGLLAGLLGIGGGLIIVPVLTYLLSTLLDIPATQTIVIAVATSLSTIIFTGMSSARAHYKLGNLNTDILLWCGVGIAIGAVAGAQIATAISGQLLKQIFAVLVMTIAAYMMFGSRRESKSHATHPRLATVGTSAGLLSALMGIGGGAILVPALVWYRVNIRQAIGCAAFSGIIIAIFGSASFILSGWEYNSLANGFVGYVYWPATVSIAVTSVLFAPIGARLGQRMNTQGLKKVFAVFLVLVSIRMLWGF